MKINSISLISVVSLLSCVADANAGALADFYVGGMVGAGGQTMFASHKNETDSTTMVGAIAGIDIPVFRAEVEYNYFDSSELSTNAAMVNAYAKMASTVIMPYIGGGIGMVFGGEQSVKNAAGTKSNYSVKSTAAYQAMLGVTIDPVVIPFKFDIEGRALYAPDIYENPENGTKPDMLQYGIRAKARFIF